MRLLAALLGLSAIGLLWKLRRDAAAWQRAEDAEDRDSTVPSSDFITLDEATAGWSGSLPSTYRREGLL